MTQTYTITHNTRTKTTIKLKAHRNISEEDGMDDKRVGGITLRGAEIHKSSNRNIQTMGETRHNIGQYKA